MFCQKWQAARFSVKIESNREYRGFSQIMRIGKIVIIFTAAIVLGGGVVWYVIYQAGLTRGIEIEITGPEKILIGVPFDIRVNLANSSQNPLENVQLSVNLPADTAFLGSPPSKNVDFKGIGTIGIDGISQQTFRLVVLGGENSFKKITASANYMSGSLSSRFQRESSLDLAVGGYGITLDIAAPQKIFSGEEFDAEITYKNSSDTDFNDLRLKIDFPPTFTVSRSTLVPDIGNNVWLLGGLRKGSENKFKISGKMIGPEGAFFDLKAAIETSFLGQNYAVSVNSGTVSIATSPLSLRMTLNDQVDYIVEPDDHLSYVLAYTNNTDVGLRDVIVKVQLVGAMYDFSSLSTNGIFRSTDNSITWNASVVPQLAALAPGQSGSVNFNLRVAKNYPIRRLSDKNFTLRVTGTIESPTVPNFVAADKTFSVASLENKVRGQATIDTKAFFRDAASGIVNTGPFPPKVNQPTRYTIHWQITNQSTDIKSVEIRSFLAGNVKMVGVPKTSTGIPGPVYNDRTQEIIWQIPRVAATTGVISKPLEAIFQVEAIPSSANLGFYMPLIQATTLRAIDEFTESELSAQDVPENTRLPDDPTVTPSQGIVIQ